ncbi:hypothetical protein EIN_404660 [Entamoeba invadens IP1]|uniref:Uncharacterized protein n=1 Tax=Entamoeba invadens IP1 TaxID=370355 RepID=A0A0A1U6P9_ENTIV|nr:hypothetical protein EIN_404660 [Entamoeba invadens IP1]ELP90072.1 hypothetical protein EIN_404660 [Entamoeba invadens IP1]|eukprot:XP_004256843.1 hypothetical protein EIN_404660 [Entamoeba invadens IP1]
MDFYYRSRQKKAVAKTQERIKFLKLKIDHDTQIISEELKLSKQCYINNDKEGATVHLKKKKMYEKAVSETQNFIINLESQILEIENLRAKKKVSDSMKDLNSAMTRLNKSVDVKKVEEVMYSLHENNSKSAELGDILSESTNDDMDLDITDDLQELEKQIDEEKKDAAKQLAQTLPVPKESPHQKEQLKIPQKVLLFEEESKASQKATKQTKSLFKSLKHEKKENEVVQDTRPKITQSASPLVTQSASTPLMNDQQLVDDLLKRISSLELENQHQKSETKRAEEKVEFWRGEYRFVEKLFDDTGDDTQPLIDENEKQKSEIERLQSELQITLNREEKIKALLEEEKTKSALLEQKLSQFDTTQAQGDPPHPDSILQNKQIETTRSIEVCVPLECVMIGGNVEAQIDGGVYSIPIQRGFLERSSNVLSFLDNGTTKTFEIVYTSKHDFFQRKDESDLSCVLHFEKGCEGMTTDIPITLLSGESISLNISIENNACYKFDGFGLPKCDGVGCGDLYVTTKIE